MIPLPVTPSPLEPPVPGAVRVSAAKRYRPGDDSVFVFHKYLFGELELSEGTELARAKPVDQPGANYFTPMMRFPAWDVQFIWNDLNAFFWWMPLPLGGSGDIEFEPDPYFPSANRLPDWDGE